MSEAQESFQKGAGDRWGRREGQGQIRKGVKIGPGWQWWPQKLPAGERHSQTLVGKEPCRQGVWAQMVAVGRGGRVQGVGGWVGRAGSSLVSPPDCPASEAGREGKQERRRHWGSSRPHTWVTREKEGAMGTQDLGQQVGRVEGRGMSC